MKIKSEQHSSADFRAFADSIGDFIQYFGFKKIHGRIWANLFLSKTPLAAVELCKRLKVSKTLLSFSIADLLKHNVIEEAGKGDRRTVFYRANPDVADVIFNVLKNRERTLLAKIEDQYRAIKLRPDIMDEARFKEMGELIQTAKSALDSLLSLNTSHADLSTQFETLALALKTRN